MGEVVQGKSIPISEIKDGMTLADSVRTPAGAIILPADTELEDKHIPLLERAGVTKVDIVVKRLQVESKKIDLAAELTRARADEKRASADVERAKRGRLRILIVDDSKLMRTKLRNILTEAGFTVIGDADNGAAGVQKAAQLTPDVVTMDIEMPEMDGLTALGALRNSNPEIKVIMVSSLGEEDKIIKSISIGATDFIRKPFDPKRVEKAMLTLMENCAGKAENK